MSHLLHDNKLGHNECPFKEEELDRKEKMSQIIENTGTDGLGDS